MQGKATATTVVAMGHARRTAAAIAVLLLLLAPLAPASSAARSRCTPAQVRSALTAFVRAFNRGDYPALDALFAQEPQFEWFSSDRPGRRIGLAAKNRGTLIRYFEARHARFDRLGLLSFRFNGNSRRWANFELRGRRSAADYRSGRWFRVMAKGAAICGDVGTRFIVLTFSGPTTP